MKSLLNHSMSHCSTLHASYVRWDKDCSAQTIEVLVQGKKQICECLEYIPGPNKSSLQLESALLDRSCVSWAMQETIDSFANTHCGVKFCKWRPVLSGNLKDLASFGPNSPCEGLCGSFSWVLWFLWSWNGGFFLGENKRPPLLQCQFCSSSSQGLHDWMA